MRNMGGLRQYMPIDVRPDVDRDAGDRRHSAARRILLEGRDPRRAVRARAALDDRAARICSAFPGRVWLYFAWVLGLGAGVHDGDVHDPHDALHLPRPEPDRRRRSGRICSEAPWIMTGPLVVLGVLTVVRRVAQPAGVRAVLGPVGVLDHWLEPVVGEATGSRHRRRAGQSRTGSSTDSSALAVFIAVGRYRARRGRGSSPRRSCRRASRRRKRASRSVLVNKYYVDEIYDDDDREAGRRRRRAACSGAASTPG